MGVRLVNTKPVEQADYSRLSNSTVTFEVPSSRYPSPGAKRGADSSTRVAVFLTSTLQTASAVRPAAVT